MKTALEILVENEVIYEPTNNKNFNLIARRDCNIKTVQMIEKSMKEYIKECLDQLFIESEHGDAEHRQWLKDKFNNFLATIK